MGFAMSKPDLRAALETDLVEICEGRKTKDEVLQEQVHRYKEVFQAAIDNVNKLDMAAQHFLEENPSNQGDGGQGGQNIFGMASNDPVVQCILCQSQLALKSKQSGGWMISCQGYPTCRTAPVWLPSSVKEASVDQNQCNRCTNNPKHIKLICTRAAMSPFFPDTYTGCLGGCEEDLLEVLGIDKLNNGHLAQAAPGNDRRGGGGGGGRAGSHARGAGGGQNRGTGAMPKQGGGRGGNATRGAARGNTRGGGSSIGSSRGGHRGGGGARGGYHGGNDSGYDSYPAGGTQSQSDTPNCNCGNKAIQRTVQKDGPNKGREFFVCGKPRDEQCNFFQWSDQPNNNPPPQANNFNQSQSYPPRQNNYNHGGGDGQEINCNCGQPSARRTVQKDGANKGRDFFCCSKPRDEQCGYFQWADELDDGPSSGYQPPGGGGGGYGPRGGRGRGGAGGQGGTKRKASNEDGGEKKQRKCGLCHEPGHTRAKCPMKSDWN